MGTVIIVTLVGVVLIGVTAWLMVSDDIDARVDAPRAWASVADRLGLDHFERTLSGTLDGVSVHVSFESGRRSRTRRSIFVAPVGGLPVATEINPVADGGWFPVSDDASRWGEVPSQDVVFGRHYVVRAADLSAAVSWLQQSPAMQTMLWLRDRDYIASLRHDTIEVRIDGWVSDESELEATIRDVVEAANRLSTDTVNAG